MTQTKLNLTPYFKPRFRLSDMSPVAVEIILREGKKKLLTPEELFQLLSADYEKLMALLFPVLNRWSEAHGILVSWTVPCRTALSVDISQLADSLASCIPLDKLEFIFDTNGMERAGATEKLHELMAVLPDKRIRKGFASSNPTLFMDSAGLLERGCRAVRFKPDTFFHAKDDVRLANDVRAFIEKLTGQGIDVIAEGLFSKKDVTEAILMGARYGEGFYLSREHLKAGLDAPVPGSGRKKTGSIEKNTGFLMDSILGGQPGWAV